MSPNHEPSSGAQAGSEGRVRLVGPEGNMNLRKMVGYFAGEALLEEMGPGFSIKHGMLKLHVDQESWDALHPKDS